jgi:hypothetical protein
MPLQRTETYLTTGTKPSWNCDPSITPFNMSVAVTFVTGPVSYKLQYTYDNFDDPLKTDASATWFDSTAIPAGTVANAQAAFTQPITRIRLVIATLTAGSITMTMLQGMSVN